ncbi:MAG TPA: glycosyltransferase family 39 protein [Chitinophagales bacterium]|nr:glycosyltransferase family 39 protein [Chitinophagales bacterium]
MKPTASPGFQLILFTVLVIGCCFPLFANLGAAPIYMWDEATYANNALDMYITQDPIVVRMEGKPDLYNTKPPFVLWMQTISLHLFGWNEFAIRLPSAFFGALTVLLLSWFSLVVLNSAFTGIVAMFTLVCSGGFLAVHVTRSGDPDATLVFWITFYVLIFIKYLLKPERPGLHFFLIAAGLIFAFLSKGIAGWFFLPLLVFLAIIHGSFLTLLKHKEIYYAAIAVLVISCGYYFLREWMAPGYWAVVYSSELMRFNNTVMSWHVQPFDFYFQNMLHGRFKPFFFPLPFSLIVFLIQEEKKNQRCLLFLWVITAGYFLLISYPADKLEWYDAPLYPFLALIIGILANGILSSIKRFPFIQSHQLAKNLVAVIVLLAFSAIPYYRMLKNILSTDEITYSWDPARTDEFRITGAFMKHLKEDFPELRGYTLLKAPPADKEHFDQLKFYQRTYQLQDHFTIGIKNDIQEIRPGEKVLVCEKQLQNTLETEWSFDTLVSWKGCKLYAIKHQKTHAAISSAPIQ